MSSLAGMSLEGWRMRRASARGRLRPARAVIAGEGPVAREAARRLAASGVAEVMSDPAVAADVVVICDGGEPAAALRQRVIEASLQAARACPSAAVVIAAARAMPLCVDAVRASGLPPWLVLAPGGMPLAASLAAGMAAAFGLDARQIQVPVVGGESAGDHAGLRVIERGIRVAGIPPGEMSGARIPSGEIGGAGVPPAEMAGAGRADGRVAASSSPSDAALAAASARLALAVLTDSRRVMCCTAWVEGSFGLPGGFVSVPVPVGARGAESPLPLRLTLEERALLQRVAAR